MTANKVFSTLGIDAAVGYAKYQSIKGEDGTFVDFLLQYDDKAAREGGDSWMNLIGGIDDNELISTIGKASAILNNGKGSFENIMQLKNGSVFNIQVTALKYKLMNGFKQRIEDSSQSEVFKLDKIAKLYEQLENINNTNTTNTTIPYQK